MHLFFKHLGKNCNYCLFLHTDTYASTKTQILLTFTLFIVIINQASSFEGGSFFLATPCSLEGGKGNFREP